MINVLIGLFGLTCLILSMIFRGKLFFIPIIVTGITILTVIVRMLGITIIVIKFVTNQ